MTEKLFEVVTEAIELVLWEKLVSEHIVQIQENEDSRVRE